MKTRVTELLGIEVPVIQGAMARLANASLAGAVSKAGGLGIIACGGAPLEWIEAVSYTHLDVYKRQESCFDANAAESGGVGGADGERSAKDNGTTSENPASRRLWRLGVHIADVSHYVPWGSSLDLDARRRATSVYLVDRVIPVSYTHLDVYKRQTCAWAAPRCRACTPTTWSWSWDVPTCCARATT